MRQYAGVPGTILGTEVKTALAMGQIMANPCDQGTPIQEQPARPSAKNSQQEDRPHLPNQNHQARVLIVEEAKTEGAKSSRRQPPKCG